MTRSGCVVIFVGVVLALGASFGARAASCGEASCVPAQGAYVSHFTGPGCTGTESYYLPYDSYGYGCRSWDGGGVCGTVRRTVTNRSYKYNGTCYDAWPLGLPDHLSGTDPGIDPASHLSIVEQLKIELLLPGGLRVNSSEVCQ